MPELLDPAVLDALAPDLVTRIIGDVQSNANGFYVRLANDFQVCWHPSLQFPGSGAGTREIVWTYPAGFSAAPALVITPTRYANIVTNIGGGINAGVGANSAGLLVVATGAGTGAVGCSVIAIGRWA